MSANKGKSKKSQNLFKGLDVTERKLKLKSGGKPVKEFVFKAKKGIKGKKITDIVKELNKKLIGDNKKKAKSYEFSIATNFEKAGWRGTEFQNLSKKNVRLFSILDYYGVEDEVATKFWDKIGADNEDDYKYKQFRVYYKYNGEPSGGCNSKLNDCLWMALKFAKGDTLRWKKPSSLKRYLGLNRCDKVPLEKLDKVEDAIKLSINVEGDYTRHSQKFKSSILLNLSNGHYTIVNKKKKLLKAFDIEPATKLYVINSKEWYDGEKFGERKAQIKIDYKQVNIHVKDGLDLKQEHERLLNEMKQLKQADDWLDLWKFKSVKKVALYQFYINSMRMDQPEDLTQLESYWIGQCSHGAIMYSKDNVTVKNAKYVDMNGMYSSIMASKYFQFPIKQGEFHKIDELVPNCYKYGIYRCEIEKGHKFFRYNKNNFYTHTDLYKAYNFGLEIKLINDGEYNLLHYPLSSRMKGNVAFGQFVDKMMKLKKVPFVKQIRNALWGALCERDNKIQTIQEDVETVLPTNRKLVRIVPDGDNHAIITTNKTKPFKTPYARLLPFLLAIARAKMLDVITKVDIVWCHTDGFITDKDVSFLPFSDKLGEWKIEKEGTVKITNLRNKTWYLNKST